MASEHRITVLKAVLAIFNTVNECKLDLLTTKIVLEVCQHRFMVSKSVLAIGNTVKEC
jgi:hypothetical protein